MVSIIIPVYNVSEYLDRCLTSVAQQSFSDIEILLIDDGSTDGSDVVCKLWATKDGRIKYFRKNNEGPGPARDYGIKEAKHDLVMFVDADDWVDETIVEKMHDKLVATDSDMCLCDRVHVNQDGEQRIVYYELATDVIEVKDNPSVIQESQLVLWAKLFRKELITDNDVLQSSRYYEEGIIPVLTALSKRICYVPEPLYYYCIDRDGAITTRIDVLAEMVNHIVVPIQEFKKRGLFQKHYEELRSFVQARITAYIPYIRRNHLRIQRAAADDYLERREEITKALLQTYIDTFGNDDELDWLLGDRIEKIIIFGSHNLSAVVNHLLSCANQAKREHYAFSSLVSAAGVSDRSLATWPVVHDNIFRRNSILSDFKKTVFEKNISEFEEATCFFIDFLEERFPIGKLGGGYFTVSEAFEEVAMQNPPLGHAILERGRDETEVLWRKSCLALGTMIEERMRGRCVVVLVKMRLAEYFGVRGKETRYADIANIRKQNEVIEECYRFFLDHCPCDLVVDVEDSDLFYTDSNYRHGCYPWHLNGKFYLKQARIVNKALCKLIPPVADAVEQGDT